MAKAKSKTKKATDKPKRKAPPKATMEVSVKGTLKGTGEGEWGGTSTKTFDWAINSTGRIEITAPCGTTYKFDKKTIKEFAALIEKASDAKVVFE